MNQTKTLARAIRLAVDQALRLAHVGLPAKVVSFDAGKRTCSVQPLLKRVIIDVDDDGNTTEKEESYPQIPNVPVMYPGGNGFHIRWTLKTDEIVWLSFADRSLETWKTATEGQEVDPVEDRAHDLKDAVAFAVMRPPSSSQPEVRDTFVIGSEDGRTEIELDTSKLTIKSPEVDISAGGDADTFMVRGDDLRNYFTQLLTQLQLHTHQVATTGSAAAQSGTAAQTLTQFSSPPSSILSQKARLK